MAFLRARPLTLSFPLIDSANRPARKTGLVLAASDVKMSKDGGAFVSAASAPVEISAGRYSLEITASEMDAGLVHLYVSKAGVDDYDERLHVTKHRAGTVSADAGNAANSFKTSLSEAAADYWKDSLLMFTTGALANQVKKITSFNHATDFVTLASSFTGTPAAGDWFILISF